MKDASCVALSGEQKSSCQLSGLDIVSVIDPLQKQEVDYSSRGSPPTPAALFCKRESNL